MDERVDNVFGGESAAPRVVDVNEVRAKIGPLEMMRPIERALDPHGPTNPGRVL